MLSAVEICNQAILKIGATRINSFDDNTVESTVVKEYYESAVKWMLSQYPWSFSLKTVELSQLPDKPIRDYEYAYSLPVDMIRLHRTYPLTDFRIEGDQLWSNERSMAVKYVSRPDERFFPSYFSQALMLYLATMICIPITENVQKESEMFMLSQDALRRAKSIDAQQHPQEGFQDFPLEEARFSGGMMR